MTMTTTTIQTIQPYLFFGGRCEEAINFYREALGAELEMLMRFKECPDAEGCSGGPMPNGENVMHASLRIGGSTVMLSDGNQPGPAQFSGFTLSLSAKDAAEAGKFFTALSDGGKVEMPLGATFFSPCFGMVEDRFGVGWMVIVPA